MLGDVRNVNRSDDIPEQNFHQQLQHIQGQLESHAENLTNLNSTLDVKLNLIMKEFAHTDEDIFEVHKTNNLASSMSELGQESTNHTQLSVDVTQVCLSFLNSL